MLYGSLQECIRKNRLHQTEARRVVFELICRSETPLRVKEIVRRIHEEMQRPPSEKSIYRIVTQLRSCHLIIGIGVGSSSYFARPGVHCTVCNVCEHLVESHDLDSPKGGQGIASTIEKHSCDVIVQYTVCPKCRR